MNSLVNRCGPTFVRNVGQRTGAPAAAIARAFAVVRDAWKLRDLWGDIEALDPALKAEAQIRMLVASQRFLTRTVQWALRRLPQPIDTMAATEQLACRGRRPGRPADRPYRRGRERRPRRTRGGLRGDGRADRRRAPRRRPRNPGGGGRSHAGGARQRRAASRRRPGSISGWASGCRWRGCAIAAHKLPREGQWPAQAALAVQDELAALHADLLASALSAAGAAGADDADAAMARWSEPRKLALDRVDRLLKEELAAAGTLDLAMLSVATAELRTLV